MFKRVLRVEDKSGALFHWQVFLYDYADRTKPIVACVKTLSSLLGGRQYVKFARRSLVDDRDFSCFGQATCFNKTLSFRDYYGHATDYSSTDLPKYIYNGVIAKFHIQVRSDLLRELQREYHSRDSHDRPGDVAHFWNVQPHVTAGALRNRVSEAILSLGKASNVSLLADTVSPRSVVGRNSASQAYVKALLDYKIIVVCQRDGWEDHFRLLEGMISGAMIMLDPMIHLPVGYQNGVNIVIYESIADLKQKILYYLEHTRERARIAWAGRRLAVEQHKPWHRMERFILGKWPESLDDPVIPLLEA